MQPRVEPATDVLAAIDEAEVLLRSRRSSQASDLLQWALVVTRDVGLLRRIRELALEGADSTRGGIAGRILWSELLFGVQRRLRAAERVLDPPHRVVWEEAGEQAVAGEVELEPESLVLDDRMGVRRRIHYADIVRARLAASLEERLNGHSTLILEHARGTTLRIGARNSGLVGHLVDLLA